MLDIQILTGSADQALQGLLTAMDNMEPALREIGEELTDSTRQRFVSTQAPDGTPWAPNSATTLERYGLTFGKSLRKKDGTLNAKGEKRLASKKPLTGETRMLGERIDYLLSQPDAVTIGSPMVYAAMQHYGGTKAEFPHLWGDIPARPIFGLSQADEVTVDDILVRYLQAPLQ